MKHQGENQTEILQKRFVLMEMIIKLFKKDSFIYFVKIGGRLIGP